MRAAEIKDNKPDRTQVSLLSASSSANAALAARAMLVSDDVRKNLFLTFFFPLLTSSKVSESAWEKARTEQSFLAVLPRILIGGCEASDHDGGADRYELCIKDTFYEGCELSAQIMLSNSSFSAAIPYSIICTKPIPVRNFDIF